MPLTFIAFFIGSLSIIGVHQWVDLGANFT